MVKCNELSILWILSSFVVFASGELALKSKKVADLVISLEEIEELVDYKKISKRLVNENDFFIAEAPLMPVIDKKVRYTLLGLRGRMPKPIRQAQY